MSNAIFTKISSVMTLFIALSFTAPLVNGHERSGQPNQPLMIAQVTEVTDDQLETFVDAYMEVEGIRERYQPRMDETDDASEIEELQREANMEMIEAIEAHGLTADQYNDIAVAVSEDSELRDRAVELIEQRHQ